MSIVTEFGQKFLLPLFRYIAPNLVDALIVNFAVGAEKDKRPHPFSLWTGMAMGRPTEGETAATAVPLPVYAPSAGKIVAALARPAFAPAGYVSWPGLVDRRYTGRHLPPAAAIEGAPLPMIEDVVRTLYLRAPGSFTPCAQTSTLFCFFAQWFTDSFLRTDPIDRRRNTSNHEIDFCQIYGLDERTTYALREHVGGRMVLDRGMLPRLTLADGSIDPRFGDLGYIRNDAPPDVGANGRINPPAPLGERLHAALGRSLPAAASAERWTRMYASGLERGNSTILYTAISTMCVREHNRVAGVLAKQHKHWDDDRLFETARVVMIRNVLKIVVEDYINHLAGGFDFKLERHFAEHQTWYRSNRISLEFNLLYRWHSLVPETFAVDGNDYDHTDYRFNNALLEQLGVEQCINAASSQRAGRIQLYNTPEFLWRAEMASIDMARTFQLQPFIAYCERFGAQPPESITELVGGNERAIADLTRLYGTIDRVELPIGLIAQARSDGDPDAVLPPLVRTMVAVDAFTHIFTNPLLSDQVHEAAFEGIANDVGRIADAMGGLAQLMARNSLGKSKARSSFKV